MTEPSDQQLELHMTKCIMNFIKIDCDMAEILIENRQPYCDRGKYIVKIFPKNIKCWVDDQDMFPRYYFIFSNVLSEMRCWIDKRKLKIISVEKFTETDFSEASE